MPPKQGAAQAAAIDHRHLERLERLSRKAMLSQAQKLDPIAFEHMVGSLFERMGYQVRTTVASGDQGVDLFVRQGRRSAVVQCKRYRGDVGAPLVRDLYGTMLHNRADEAYMVTTGNISNQARQWAEGKPIQLIDGFALVEWISTLGRGKQVRRRRWLLAAALVGMLSLAFVYSRGGLPVAWDALASLTVSSIQSPVNSPTPPASISDPTAELPSAPTPASPTVEVTPLPAPPPPPDEAAVVPTPTPQATRWPSPEPPGTVLFTNPEWGYTFAYDSRWLPENQAFSGRVQGAVVKVSYQGYAFQVQAQARPFAVPFCPTPTRPELAADFRAFTVNGLELWRPRIEEGVVALGTDGSPLPIHLLSAPNSEAGDPFCIFSAGRGFLAVSYSLPAGVMETGGADATILAQMDAMLQSLVWDGGLQ